MKFSDELIRQGHPYWAQATEHPFIQEMVNGTLHKKSFSFYLIQDYVFINAFVDLVSYTLAYAKTMQQKHRLSTFLSMITSDEDDYFIRSFKALGVKKEEYSDPSLSLTPSLKAFKTLIEKVIQSDKDAYARCLTVLACAESVYCEWGIKNRDKSPSQFYFNEWIKLHNNDFFQSFVQWLKQELDTIGQDNNVDLSTLQRLFRQMCQYEAQFFDECYVIK